MNTISLATFATKEFYESRDRLIYSAMRFGISRFFLYTEDILRASDFYLENKKILDLPRGAGYWLWKPYFILEAMKELNDGELLLYLDAGIDLLQSPRDLLEISLQNQDVALFTDKLYINRQWTKRDVFVALDADDPKYWDSECPLAGMIALRKSPFSTDFISAWLGYCRQENLLTDVPNYLGKPNFPEFRDNRHDQAILSVLSKRENIPYHRDPSQWGNHAINDFPSDIYPQVFNLHRTRQKSKNKRIPQYLAAMQASRRLHNAEYELRPTVLAFTCGKISLEQLIERRNELEKQGCHIGDRRFRSVIAKSALNDLIGKVGKNEVSIGDFLQELKKFEGTGIKIPFERKLGWFVKSILIKRWLHL